MIILLKAWQSMQNFKDANNFFENGMDAPQGEEDGCMAPALRNP